MPEPSPARLPEVFRFYAPLAATSVLMMVTHSVISGAVANTAFPALALAAYSAAYSVGAVFESPCYGLQRMGLTFMKGKKSMETVYKTGGAILVVILTLYGLTAWTPLAKWVFESLLGVPDDIYPLALASVRVFILWPLTSAIRSIFQPPIVLAKRTVWLSVNIVFRVAVMVAAATLLPRVWPNGPVGATILVLGLGTEAVLAMLVTFFAIPAPKQDPEGDPPVTSREVLSFTLPLSVAASVQTLARPVLTFALLRAVSPELTLAGFQVSSSFSYIFVALTYNIYHAVVVYVKDAASYRRIQAFSLGLGVLGFVLMAVCSIPQVAAVIFGGIIGAPGDISLEAAKGLTILTLSAPTSAAMEFYSGILMLKRRAQVVTLAKMANMASSCLIAVGMAGLFPSMGFIAGAAALSFGPLIEAAISYRVIHRTPECQEFLAQPEARTAAM